MNTDARLTVTILGSGTCVPSTSRGTAAYLVSHLGRRYLMDSGSGTIARLAAVGVPVHDLDALLYTHLHLDHTGDLFNILFSMRNSAGMSRRGDLRIYGPVGFKAHFDALMTIYGGWVLTPEYNLHVVELGGDGASAQLTPELKVEAFTMRHSAPAVGYRWTAIQDGSSRSFAFTGDADESDKLQPLLRGVDLAIMDCSTLDKDKIGGHLSSGQVASAATLAAPARLLLTHFYPPLSMDPSPAVEQVQRETGIPTAAAWDGLVMVV